MLLDGAKHKDVSVSVDAKSIAEAGIILRFQDPKNYVLACYAPKYFGLSRSPINESIYIREFVDGWPGDYLGLVQVPGLGPDIHLDAKLEGSMATLTVSDGIKTATARHEIEHFTGPGGVGLSHSSNPTPQQFDNFRLMDIGGDLPQIAPGYEDGFDGPGGKPVGWTTVRTVEEGLAKRFDAIGWHPYSQVDPDHPHFRTYRQQVEQFRADCAALGFEGQLAANGNGYGARHIRARSRGVRR